MADPPAGEAGFREQFTRFAEEIRHLANAVFAETSTSPSRMPTTDPRSSPTYHSRSRGRTSPG
jgi:hypothetical protein